MKNTTPYSTFISEIAQLMNISNDSVDINSITQAPDGTVIISGSAPVENNNNAAITSAAELYNNITNNPNAFSWPVLSKSTAGMSGDTLASGGDTSTDKLAAWIVGIAIGIGLLLLFVSCLIPILYLLCRKKKN
jgi:thiol:disulfide interchange protein